MAKHTALLMAHNKGNNEPRKQRIRTINHYHVIKYVQTAIIWTFLCCAFFLFMCSFLTIHAHTTGDIHNRHDRAALTRDNLGVSTIATLTVIWTLSIFGSFHDGKLARSLSFLFLPITFVACCPAGYVNTYGVAKCLPCPANTYSNTSHCIDCPYNSYSSVGSASCTVAVVRQNLTEITRFPTQVSAGARYGCSIAIDGDIIAVGAYYDDELGDHDGVVLVYESLSLTARLTPHDYKNYGQFGKGVAVSGTRILVSSRNAAYLFEKNGRWNQTTKLPIVDVYYSSPVDLYGDMCLIATYSWRSGDRYGQVHIYERDTVYGNWSRVFHMAAESVGDGFGQSLSLSYDKAVIGADLANCAYVLERVDGVWSHTTKLSSHDGDTGDHFGNGIAVTSDSVLVSAKWSDDYSGAVYMFKRSMDGWIETQKIVAVPRISRTWFGSAIAVSGDNAVFGAEGYYHAAYGSGAAYQFMLHNGNWTQVKLLTASDGGEEDHFGEVVTMSGSVSVIGGPDKESNTGAAYVFGCGAATYYTASVCAMCPAGRTHNRIGASSINNCTMCLSGTSSSSAGLPCRGCDKGYYAPTDGAIECIPCPPGTMCPDNSTSVPETCQPGTYNTLEAQQLCFVCPRPSHCLGGYACAHHTVGTLCGQCEVGYFLMEDKCIECPTIPWFLIIAMCAAAALTAVFVTVRIPPIVVTQFKQIVAFIQSVSLVFAINIQWPDFVQWLRSILSSLYLDIDVVSPECLIKGHVDWYVKYWLSLLVAGSMPMIVLILVWILSGIRRLLLKRANATLSGALTALLGGTTRMSSQCKLFLSMTKIIIQVSRLFILVLSITYVPVTQIVATSLVCIDSPIGTVLSQDTSISCNAAEHRMIAGISIAVIVLFTLLMPIIISFIPPIIAAFGWEALDRQQVLNSIYESYSPKYAYFEGITMIRRGLYVLVLVLEDDVIFQGVFIMLITLAYITAVVYFRPFAPIPVSINSDRLLINTLNHAEIICAIGVFLNALLSFFPKASMAVSIVSGTTVAAAFVSLFIPFITKQQAKQAVTTPIDSIDDPRVLLGKGEGRWLMALEKQLKHILDESIHISPKFRIDLVGAYKIWIDRLNGRLQERRLQLLKFHPDIGEFTPTTSPDATLYSVKLTDLKFREGRKKAYGQTSQKLESHCDDMSVDYKKMDDSP